MKRSILAAIFFISVGIVFGVVLVSDFNGVDLSFAQQKQVQLGAEKKPGNADLNLQAAHGSVLFVVDSRREINVVKCRALFHIR